MAVNRDKSADHLTFSQRYGYEPLPEPMQLEYISLDLRREIWNRTRQFIISTTAQSGFIYRSDFSLNSDSRSIEIILGKILRKPEDEIDTDDESVYNQFKKIILKHPFNEVLDFLECFFDYLFKKTSLDYIGYIEHVKGLFEYHLAAYLLNTSQRPFQFIPRSSKEQGEATRQAVETIQKANMDGASTHLKNAAKNINERQFPDSVRESIHAVEAVARRIDPTSSTLGDALKSLEKKNLLNNNQLKSGFEKLYAYTNSEEGVRHALVFQNDSKVGLDEALFMFGACASFAAYLVSKHQQQAEKRETDG